MADEQLKKILEIVQKVDIRLQAIEKGQEELRNDVATLHKGQDTMMTIVDEISEKQDRFEEGQKEQKDDLEKIIEEQDRQRQEDVAGTYLLGEHSKDISKLDQRVTKLEVSMA